MKRIDWVRVVVARDSVRAEVSGVGHRLPRTLRVSIGMASALVAQGVPLVVQRSIPAARAEAV